jgi:YVTN family beta-propeller protein
MLDFRILGPLQVLDDGRTVELGGARQRTVLAILLLHRGETVPTERIVDLMWGEQPPATAVKTVQVYVSHLRRALVADVISSSRGGYVLMVGAECVDAQRFERLLDEGRAALVADDPESAAALLRTAQELWRGPALGELAYERFAQDDAARLEELRLAAVEERIEADLRLGRQLALVPELERFVREYPLRERARAQHMLALYRSGRQADALQSYREARRALTDDLGLEPGRQLRELERAILAQDPALDLPRAHALQPAGRRGLALIATGSALAVAVAVAVVITASSGGAAVIVRPDSVVVIDPEDGRIVADVPVQSEPEALVADGRSVWVANVADGSVSQIDVGKRRVVANMAPDIAVEGLAVGGGSAWIADSEAGRAVRLDPEFGSVADAEAMRFPTRDTGIQSGTPNAAAFGQDSLWVVSARLAAVFRIDAASRRVSERFDVGNNPTAIAVGAGAAWVTDSTDNTLIRIAPAGDGAVMDTIAMGNGPGAIAASETAVWVANSRDGNVSRIDPATRAVDAVIKVGQLPSGLAVGAGAVWVANSLSGTVSRIDPRTNRVTQTIHVGGAPRAVAVAAGHLWVSVQAGPRSPVPSREPATARVLLEESPSNASGLVDEQLLRATCARLMFYESSSGADARLVPEVAAAAPVVSDGGRTYTFRLRPSYRFSPPSGRPVTAAAFERAIERTVHPRSSSWGVGTLNDVVGVAAYRAGRADTIAGVTARGDRLTIKLTRPDPTLPARLSTSYFCAVPPNTPIRPRGLERVAAAGPYYISESTPRNRLMLRRNPNYSGPRSRHLEAIEVRIGVTQELAVAEVEAGRADYVRSVPPDAQSRLLARYGPGSRAAAAGRQRYFAGPYPAIDALVFNPRRPLFARAAMRRAVNYAIDRRALSRHRDSLSTGRPTDQHIPPGYPGFRDATIYPLGGPDLATARRLAGGARRRGVLYTCNRPVCIERSEIVRSNLAAIGIELEIHRFSTAAMYDRLAAPDEPYDVSLFGWIGEAPDPSQFLDVMFRQAASTGFVDHTRLGRRLRVARRLEGAVRLKAYGALDRDIAAQAAAFAPYLSSTNTDFFSARMGCQVEHPLYGIDLAALCIHG